MKYNLKYCLKPKKEVTYFVHQQLQTLKLSKTLIGYCLIFILFFGNVNKCPLGALIYKLFLKIFYEKMIKQLILLTVFYFFIKIILKLS